MREAMIEAGGLVRTFGEDRAVDGVDLQVAAGEVHAIVGLNGAGKTTLMRMLLGMLRPTAGTARLDGAEVATAGPGVWRRVGCMIEAQFVYPELTVRENLRGAALLHGLPRDGIGPQVDRVIGEFLLGRWEHKRARTLSLGNKQRLGLAAALLHRPSILILDEPSNALDPAGVVFVRDLLRDAAADGAAVLVSSHHLDQLARVADRITVLHRGVIVGDLDPGGTDLEERFFSEVYEADRVRAARATGAA